MRIIPGAPLRLVLATALAVASVQAQTGIPPTFGELVATADVVVDGEVTGVRSQIERHDGLPVVYTPVAIVVADTMEDSARATMALRIRSRAANLNVTPATHHDGRPEMNRPGMEELRYRA